MVLSRGLVEQCLWVSTRIGQNRLHDRTISREVEPEALASAIEQLGWRVYATNQGADGLSLPQAVEAYRDEYLVERNFGRLKGHPLSLSPMYVERDDHATGLVRLLSLAL